jgi:hypothetical protein
VLALRLEQRDVGDPLQRRVRPPDLVQPARERQQRAVERPLLDLVLLRVEVLLACPFATGTRSTFSKPE